jgi:hypothetical protein
MTTGPPSDAGLRATQPALFPDNTQDAFDGYLDQRQFSSTISGLEGVQGVTQSTVQGHAGRPVRMASSPTPPPLSLDLELQDAEDEEDSRMMNDDEMEDITSRLDHMDEAELRSSARSLAAHAAALTQARKRERKRGNDKVGAPLVYSFRFWNFRNLDIGKFS